MRGNDLSEIRAPFEDAADFERFCRDIQAEVDAGRVRVVDYPAAHPVLPRFRRLRRMVCWCHLKLRQYAFRVMHNDKKTAVNLADVI